MMFPFPLSRFCMLGLCTLFSACAVQPTHNTSDVALSCEYGIAAVYDELDRAEANTNKENNNLPKARSYITAAEIQQRFNRYPKCIDNLQRAKSYISQSRKLRI